VGMIWPMCYSLLVANFFSLSYNIVGRLGLFGITVACSEVMLLKRFAFVWFLVTVVTIP